MILAGDLDAAGEVVAHRMVDPTVTELELISGEAKSEREQLMS